MEGTCKKEEPLIGSKYATGGIDTGIVPKQLKFFIHKVGKLVSPQIYLLGFIFKNYHCKNSKKDWHLGA